MSKDGRKEGSRTPPTETKPARNRGQKKERKKKKSAEICCVDQPRRVMEGCK